MKDQSFYIFPNEDGSVKVVNGWAVKGGSYHGVAEEFAKSADRPLDKVRYHMIDAPSAEAAEKTYRDRVRNKHFVATVSYVPGEPRMNW